MSIAAAAARSPGGAPREASAQGAPQGKQPHVDRMRLAWRDDYPQPVEPVRVHNVSAARALDALHKRVGDLSYQVAQLENRMVAERAASQGGHDARLVILEKKMEAEQLSRLKREGDILRQMEEAAASEAARAESTKQLEREVAAERERSERQHNHLQQSILESSQRHGDNSYERDAMRSELESAKFRLSSLRGHVTSAAEAQAMRSDSIARALANLNAQLQTTMQETTSMRSFGGKDAAAQLVDLRKQMVSLKKRINIVMAVTQLKRKASKMQHRIQSLEKENAGLRKYVQVLGGANVAGPFVAPHLEDTEELGVSAAEADKLWERYQAEEMRKWQMKA